MMSSHPFGHSIDLQHSEQGGKFAVAARDIEAGEWVCVDVKPLALSQASGVKLCPTTSGGKDYDEAEQLICQQCYGLLNDDDDDAEDLSFDFQCPKCCANFCSRSCLETHEDALLNVRGGMCDATAPHAAVSCLVAGAINHCQELREASAVASSQGREDSTHDSLMDDDEVQFLGLIGMVIFRLVSFLRAEDGENTRSTWQAALGRVADSDRCWRLDLESNWAHHSQNMFIAQGYQHMMQLFVEELAPVLFADQSAVHTTSASVEGNGCQQGEHETVELGFMKLCSALQCNSFSLFHLYDSNKNTTDAAGLQHFKRVAVGVYLEASYFNHSCVPNIARVMGAGPKTHCGGSGGCGNDLHDMIFSRIASLPPTSASFIAIRPIQAGEPLCISYVNTFDSFEERQAECREHYCFECACPMCSSAVDGGELSPRGMFDTPRCSACVAKGYLLPLCGMMGGGSVVGRNDQACCLQCGLVR